MTRDDRLFTAFSALVKARKQLLAAQSVLSEGGCIVPAAGWLRDALTGVEHASDVVFARMGDEQRERAQERRDA